MGDVETGQVITAVALNGRSFTDLLRFNPASCPCRPRRTIRSSWRVSRWRSCRLGALNPGNQSINGQREDSNGFLVNGCDVKELMNGGTPIMPDLDSIGEFRVLTNNFDAEHGNYGGGIVNVVTQSGADEFTERLRVPAKYRARCEELFRHA